MFAFTDEEASAWSGCEQVHLVRFDVDGRRVFAFADGPSREIIRGRFCLDWSQFVTSPGSVKLKESRDEYTEYGCA
jgi:hypothetical protein